MGVPSDKNKLKTVVKTKRIITGFNPFTMYFNGTLDTVITPNKNRLTIKYPEKLLNKNKDIIYINVPINFVLASNL